MKVLDNRDLLRQLKTDGKVQNSKLTIILASMFGIFFGFMVPATKVVMDNASLGMSSLHEYVTVFEFLRGYLFAGGQHLSVVFKLLVGTVGGMAVFGALAIIFVSRRNRERLSKISSSFDTDSHYLVQQRGRETMTIAIVLFVVAVIVLYVFNVLHTIGSSSSLLSTGRKYSSIGYPAVALFATLTLCIFIVAGALITLYGALNYGRYDKIPIGLESDVLSFYKCFFGLPVIAIDKPVSVNLNHAEVDFKTQGGKGYLHVYNANAHLMVSPKLEFYNGSFDELADYVERFAVQEDE